jgi:glucokinase
MVKGTAVGRRASGGEEGAGMVERGRGLVGVDLGGTKTALALMDDRGEVVARDVFATQAADGVEAWLERAAAAARRLAPGGVRAVGVGAAGQVDPSGVLVATANVGGWRGVNLGARLGERLGCPGTTDNDAKVELMAELDRGAARGCRTALLVAVGTGIGGAIAVDGRVYRGAHGFAGEVGHAFVAGGDRPCGCGRAGHLETLASGTGILHFALERARGRPDGVLAEELEREPGARAVFAAARRGDADAQEVLDAAADLLGGSIAALVTVLDPEVVILAGGVAAADDAFWRRARRAFEDAVHPTLERTPWRPAALGEGAGAIGACLVARSLVA